MYPIVRTLKEIFVQGRAPAMGPLDLHVSHHLCWPWDLDIWGELNNGRTLTLYDLGRVGLARRTALSRVMMRERWSLVVAGSSVRFRKRVRAFHRIEMRTRMIGWDARFIYVEQSMWRRGMCCSHMLLRAAATDANGIVATERLAAAMGVDPASPPLPGWVQAWIAAEAERPWPPMADAAQAQAA